LSKEDLNQASYAKLLLEHTIFLKNAHKKWNPFIFDPKTKKQIKNANCYY